MKYDIFISYRRGGGTYQARALKSDLELNGYKNRVFMDTHSLKGGDFTRKLKEMIRESGNFVVIISKGCFNIQKEGTDYFLYEISQALKQGKNLIPIYYDGIKYEDIKEYLSDIEDFPKQNAITYHIDSPDETISKIISFLKSEEEILKEGFYNLSRKRNQFRQELLLLNRNSSEFHCPICHKSYSATMSYCQECGFKFFDELEKSVAEKYELLQEKERIQKHKEIWEKAMLNNSIPHSEQILLLQSEVSNLKNKIYTLSQKNRELEKEIEERRTQLKEHIYVCRALEGNICESKNDIGRTTQSVSIPENVVVPSNKRMQEWDFSNIVVRAKKTTSVFERDAIEETIDIHKFQDILNDEYGIFFTLECIKSFQTIGKLKEFVLKTSKELK